MEIVDAQIHRPKPTLEANAGLDGDALAVELALAAMRAAGVDAAVIVGAPEFCEYAATAAPGRFAGVVRLDPEPSEIDVFVAGLRARPGLLGLRIVATSPLRPDAKRKFDEGFYDAWFASAERHGVPVCLYVPGEPGRARAIAIRHPDLVLVIDHLGLRHPPRDPAGPELFAPLPDLLALAAFRNVAVKFSGVPALSRERYPFGDIWPEARRVIDAFGPDRLMWGSDYTRCERLHSYADSVDFVRCSEDLSESDKAALMGGTLRRILRWHRTPP